MDEMRHGRLAKLNVRLRGIGRWRVGMGALAIPVCGVGLIFSSGSSGPRASGGMTQDVYIWQRVWAEPVRTAVTEYGKSFQALAVLGAQVSWDQNAAAGLPRVMRVGVDWAALQATGQPVAIAIRVNEYRGNYDFEKPGSSHAGAGQTLAELAASLLEEARERGVAVVEVQIDFDAAESKLLAYRAWVEAIGQRISPVAVGITVLPSWLDAPGFEALARSTGSAGYVLQVHSFEKPALGEKMTLCDPQAARAAVEKAGKIGAPFRVALPTYGYLVAFDGGGKFIGLSAEGQRAHWPAGAMVREVRAEPAEIAPLVSGWMQDRPAAMTGLIWYRLPIERDAMNWRWPTLAAVMQGRSPIGDLKAAVTAEEPGVRRVELINHGEGEARLDGTVFVSSRSGVEAADGLGGFAVTWGEAEARFAPIGRGRRLAAGERVTVGWLRVKDATEEVRADVAR